MDVLHALAEPCHEGGYRIFALHDLRERHVLVFDIIMQQRQHGHMVLACPGCEELLCDLDLARHLNLPDDLFDAWVQATGDSSLLQVSGRGRSPGFNRRPSERTNVTSHGCSSSSHSLQ